MYSLLEMPTVYTALVITKVCGGGGAIQNSMKGEGLNEPKHEALKCFFVLLC